MNKEDKVENRILEGIFERQRKNRLIKEIFRKTIHICSSFVPFFLKIAYWPVIGLLIFAVLFYSVCEFFHYKGYTIPVISKITEVASRKRDENRFVLGPVTLVIGILITALSLPLEFAKVGIFALSFGDGFASLVGKAIGKHVIPGTQGKTIEGSLACFTAVFISTFCCSKNVFLSFIIAFCAMMIEVLPLKDFDNVLIPIAIGWIYRLLFSVFS